MIDWREEMREREECGMTPRILVYGVPGGHRKWSRVGDWGRWLYLLDVLSLTCGSPSGGGPSSTRRAGLRLRSAMG